MGMCMCFHSVSDTNIEKILSFPPLIWKLVAPEDEEAYLESLPQPQKKSFWSGIFGSKTQDKIIPDIQLIFKEGENKVVDIDKAWQGIHYCLNKTEYDAEPPLDFITTGGEVAGDIEVGLGPARLMRSKDVIQLSSILSAITIESLRENYNPTNMANLNIYPDIWESEGDEAFEYLADFYKNLKLFIAECADKNFGIAIYLS